MSPLNYLVIFFSNLSQNIFSSLTVFSLLISCIPVGEVTLISVKCPSIMSIPAKNNPLAFKKGPTSLHNSSNLG